MFKMGSHDPFGHLKHKLWPKEGLKIKLAIWFMTIKSLESPQFSCVKVACHISLESSQWGLQLFFNPHLNQMSAHKVIGPQSYGSPKTKWHLGADPVARHIIYYKGEGDGFPQVWAMVSLVSPCLLVVRSCTKNVQSMQ
jgi:hypothetical protein